MTGTSHYDQEMSFPDIKLFTLSFGLMNITVMSSNGHIQVQIFAP